VALWLKDTRPQRRAYEIKSQMNETEFTNLIDRIKEGHSGWLGELCEIVKEHLLKYSLFTVSGLTKAICGEYGKAWSVTERIEIQK